MKKRWLWPGIIAQVIILSTSCSDNEPEIGQNKIRIYGTDHELTSGVLWHGVDNRIIETKEYVFNDRFTDENGEEKSVEVKGFTLGAVNRTNGNFLLSLYDPGLSYNEKLRIAQGKGACICFHMSSPDRKNLATGTYTWGELKEDFTFTAYYNSIYDPVALKTTPAEISTGKVVVERNEGRYSVGFDLETEFGANIQGTYVGYLDTCKIEGRDVMTYMGVKIEALLDTVKVVLIAPDLSPTPLDMVAPGPDFTEGRAFYSASGGVSATTDESNGNSNMDIALAYNRTNETVVFESPLKMGIWLWHHYEFTGADNNMKLLNHPCHTRYMLAPESFTEDDFNKITIKDDLDFVIEGDPLVEIPIVSVFPKFVFFETGKGIRGIIKVTEASPFIVKETDFSAELGFPAKTIANVHPFVTVDMKNTTTLSDMKIR